MLKTHTVVHNAATYNTQLIILVQVLFISLIEITFLGTSYFSCIIVETANSVAMPLSDNIYFYLWLLTVRWLFIYFALPIY